MALATESTTADAPTQDQDSSARLREKLIDYLQDAHALEDNVLRMLDSMISLTADAEVLTRLRMHRLETVRHARLVRERLEAHGAAPSVAAEVPAVAGAWVKGLGDMLRADKPGKNARDAYITEHVEIAAYSLLERLAVRAGDLETVRTARFIRSEEEQMADWIADHWDLFIDLTLGADGIVAPGARGDGAGRDMMSRLAPFGGVAAACAAGFAAGLLLGGSRR